jgi:hypothetical protein
MNHTTQQIELIEKELNQVDVYNLFDEMLNDCYPEIEICGLKYSPSLALKRVDETAYCCSANDYIDSLISDGTLSDEIGGEHYFQNEIDDLLNLEI